MRESLSRAWQSRRGMAMLCAGILALVFSAPAAAGAETISVGRVVDRACTVRELTGAPGAASRTLTSPVLGWMDVRLSAASGDWDLAIFDAETGTLISGSAYSGADELASGIVFERERVLIQACRRSGASTARLTIAFAKVDRDQPTPPPSIVRISTPTRAVEQSATSLGLDLTEHGGPGFIEAVLHGPADAAKLTGAGLNYTTRIANLQALDARNRRADSRYARLTQRPTALPSGRDSYRRLFDYSEELKALAKANRKLVRPITLPFKTWEGRKVEGIEIATNVRRKDGRPVFFIMGVHHAREWPSGEHTMEWAYELIRGFKAKRPAFRKLVRRTRTIVVPVINPDGFNASREAGELQGAGGGRGGGATQETVNIVSHPNEYRRKNCRFADDSKGGSCNQPSAGLAEPGVDPNRNYGNFWGGPGASGDPTAQDYYGPGPFSEPETRNVRRVVSRRQVVTLVTNHTFSNLILRPPGLQSQGDPIDEPVYKRLGDAMAAENGYESQKGYELYDTTGTTEDWTYSATGGLGFTFEIGPTNFHPPFAEMVAEYRGTTLVAGAEGGGNRAAYLIAQRNTANAKRHSVLQGMAPPRSTLRLTKSFRTPTSQDTTFKDRLFSAIKVPRNGRFVWHINPSTRPLVAKQTGRAKTGEPSPPESFSGAPGPSAAPCGDAESNDPTCFNDHPFTVPQGAAVDNAKASVRVDWPAPTSDWDMQIFRDANGDGSSEGETQVVGASQQGTTNFEETTVTEPALRAGEKYVVRLTNFAASEPYDGTITYRGPDPVSRARKERWTLTCMRGKNVLARSKIYIERGQRKRLDLRRACAT